MEALNTYQAEPKKEKKDDFIEMYEILTDPEKREEAQRKHQINKHLEDKKSDTGC